ncbi:hypothetical protein TNCV_938211 [Trichonephila clavipes]|nr:hypothetical protein TNCV_938211 [Trichonephila clavipes]
MSVSLSHWKHVAWERVVSSWNTEFLASSKALWTERFFPTIYQRLKSPQSIIVFNNFVVSFGFINFVFACKPSFTNEFFKWF